ncbi:Co/Zn/Cd efflux system protein [Chelonobacter oris]|uniref:Cytochrome C1 n=1 Tax=Chelonobacter oris TaxID=505317 RepID=A0A0A3AUU9_9PAST|nr:cation diffusion facilitator family transporter [Chelonobacter oris]KGQ70885.1 cytochrome C1 [Chelonobacter oris]MDH2999361.1 Co/Zn/Cd efflux system protein [Chelonobacter oris]
MSNHHSHQHSDHIASSAGDRRRLMWSFCIISGFMLIEFLGGYLFNSLALTADAGHMANDSLSLGVALSAVIMANKFPGLSKRLALINGASLILIALYIIYEAIIRLKNPSEVIALPMILVAILGLAVNVLVAKMMVKADQDNLNIRAAYLHVLADLLGSVVAIAAGLSALLLGWQWVDPAASLLLSGIILQSGTKVTYAAVKALSAETALELDKHSGHRH